MVDRGFGKRDRKTTKDRSVKTKYRCAFAKRRAKNPCEAECIIFEPSNRANVFIIQYNGQNHNHEDLDEEDISSRISFEMIKMIIECDSRNMTAKQIIAHIDNLKESHPIFLDEKTPTAQQIYYLVRKHKNGENPPIISIGELNEWCEKHSVVPSSDDESFVLNYETSNENEKMFFRYVVSTKRLIAHYKGIDQVCSDATYKLTWQGFPYLIIGTVDRAKKLHPLTFCCASNEKEDE